MIENNRKDYDPLLRSIVDYILNDFTFSELAYLTAEKALLDSLGCAMQALHEKQCRALLGPVVPGTKVPFGARVPGTSFELDPIKAAFDIGSCIRWLDYNDTWLAKEWAHPSDNLGGILALADYLSRNKKLQNQKPITLQDVFDCMIKAYEIQGILALDNSFNAIGLDHVILVKIATTAVAAKLFEFSEVETLAALSHAFVDGASLRTYRHAPNTVPRKSWAAGDATRRGVEIAYWIKKGQIGMPSILSTKKWGFNDIFFAKNPLHVERPFNSYVMENVLFKVAFPAEFHAQTAIECALKLHPLIKNRLEDIDKVEIFTQEPAIRIIHKEGPLYNYADRDHSLQYIVAIALIFGEVKHFHYMDEVSLDPRIDALRKKMVVQENKDYSRDYLDPNKRSIANALQIFFETGEKTDRIEVHYPLGHKNRRKEAETLLQKKYEQAILSHFEGKQAEDLCALWNNVWTKKDDSIDDFISLWVK